MSNNELKQLEQDLSDAFPDWFRRSRFDEFNICRHDWVIVNCVSERLTSAYHDALLGACLDAARSRGWEFKLSNWSRNKYVFFVYHKTGEHITTLTHEIPAIAAALAILTAHKLEVKS
jgi:glutamate/tyrosine decarboxylase-like PLP-dependent enzyme